MYSDDLSGLIITMILFIVIILVIIGIVWAVIQDSKTSPSSMNTSHPKTSVIKTVYFYLVSLISLFMVVFATADLVNLGLKIWVFPKADKQEYVEPPCPLSVAKIPDMKDEEYQRQIQICEANRLSEGERLSIQHQRDAVRDLSFLVVGLPLFLYHWRIIRRESREEKETK